ncbi:MAG TPA: DUF4173 domain-containing protein [Candidatus Methylomirabilis sp.]|nr:DUF4173 domain-containing protein [Candidatus Methylomirabilis sp.]
MDHPHHPAHVVFGVAGAALAAVLGFHFLLYGHQYGFALVVFLLILAGSVVGLYVLGGRQGNAWAFFFLVPLILSLLAEALSASEVVRFFGFILSVGSLALFTYWLTSPSVPFWDLSTLWPSAMLLESFFPFKRFGGFFHALAHGKGEVRRVLMGVVVAVPFLFLIGLLFVSSDLLLQKTLNDLLTPEALERFLKHAIWDLFAAVFFLSAGWTVISRITEARRPKESDEPRGFDAVVTTTFLSLMNLLFISFIVYQFVTVFGGASVVEARGITYAAYAREGFFQLLAVSVIVLAILGGIYRYTGMRSWAVRWLSAALVIETGAVIASALRRIALYIDAYGLTLLRLWSTFAIVLIALAFAVLLVGTFSKVRFKQVLKSLAVGSVTVLSLSLLVNTEDLIVRFNFNRYIRKNADTVDIRYLMSLSSDAVPALVEYSRLPWPSENPDPITQQQLASFLKIPSDIPSDVRDEALREAVSVSDRVRLVERLRGKTQRLRDQSANDPFALVISDYRAISAVGY